MTDETTLQRDIASLLFQDLHVEVSSVHDDLIESGLLDSLKIVELLVELEQRFEMKISLNDLEIDSFRSVAKIADLVATAKGAAEIRGAAVTGFPDERLRSPLAD